MYVQGYCYESDAVAVSELYDEWRADVAEDAPSEVRRADALTQAIWWLARQSDPTDMDGATAFAAEYERRTWPADRYSILMAARRIR